MLDGVASKGGGRGPLTPLLFFLAIIWEVVVGEFDLITELALCL